jgi:hypothetical protein
MVMSDDDDLRFTAQEFGTLLEWLMASDPFPLEQSRRQRMVDMLNDEARARSYDDWIQAYHDNRMEDDPRDGHQL